MNQLDFSSPEAFFQPIYELVEGIVNIVEEKTVEEKKKISDDLIEQIFISTTIMHLSEQAKAKNVPSADEIKKLMDKDDKTSVLNSFTQGIDKENLLKYIEESATIVMTNFYFQVKDKLDDQKTTQIENLQQKIQESL
ncbi:hypothetical protein KJZ63_01700 [Patescibacteria group bacterium]|nr:hypothetical protein [Patescibacteria group bacterium]